MSENSNLFFNENLEDQENSTKFLNNLKNKKNIDGVEVVLDKIGTPRAKSVLSNRKVLAEKTPINVGKRAFSPSKSSPSLLSLPLAHPSIKEIAATAETLSNPPDLFLQPLQKRRSIRHRPEKSDNEEEDIVKTDKNITNNTITSKLVVVFPTTSDELDDDLDEIEHAASSLVNDDEDANTFLFGPSKIIPNLELHENLDFSSLLDRAIENVENNIKKAAESVIIIEPIIVDFKLDDEQKK